jgi:hypothetical protein
MTRSLTKVALTAAVFALVAAPGVAFAQTAAEVDEQTGPVSFANAASVVVDTSKVVTETQRSPLRAGQSKLSQDRSSVPKSGDQGEINAMGPNYWLSLGKFGSPSPFPAGVKSLDHQVVAELKDTNVPVASATADYALLDNGRGGPTAGDNSVFALVNAKTSVDCSATNAVKATTSADKLWVRGADDKLAPVAVPTAAKPLVVPGIRVGAPMQVAGIDPAKTRSTLTISRLSSFDQLVKQDVWRSGAVTAAAGWQAEITTHVVKLDGNAADVHTKFVLGGVSCSLPKGFVAKAAANSQVVPATSAVPTNVPAGGAPPVVAEAAGNSPLGFALFGGGVVLALGAVLVLRRRRPTSK